MLNHLIMTYNAIGLMSGTSLDGLDIVYVEISYRSKWNFKIKKAQTIKYDEFWGDKLLAANHIKGFELIQLNKDFGTYIGLKINTFIEENKIERKKIDLISSHGHTVFHQPKNGFTYQIGCGLEISRITKIKTICDFRSLDVAHGGQGAPLVPIGDIHLFGNHKYCLNIGGIANISFDKNNKRIAGDIDFANINSNFLAKSLGFEMDVNGRLAEEGKLNNELLQKLSEISFYDEKFPKSLGVEDYHKWYKPILDDFNIKVQDKLHTTGFHLCSNIKKIIDRGNSYDLLITGGGAFNKFWLNTLIKMGINIVIPKKEIIDYKEALIFAFLGVLYVRNEVNTLSSVTGASKDLKSGILYDPKNF